MLSLQDVTGSSVSGIREQITYPVIETHYSCCATSYVDSCAGERIIPKGTSRMSQPVLGSQLRPLDTISKDRTSPVISQSGNDNVGDTANDTSYSFYGS